MNRNRRMQFLGFLILFFGVTFLKIDVNAAGVRAYFGTEEGYVWNLGEKSPIGFYLESEDKELTEVELVVTYDPTVLRLVSQGDNDITVLEEGKFSLKQGGEFENVYKKIVHFVPLVSAETSIEIVEAKGKVQGSESYDIEGVSAKVQIPIEEGCELRSIEIDGEKLEGYDSKKLQYELQVGEEVDNLPVNVTVYDGTEAEVSDTALVVGENLIYITTINESKEKARYTLVVVREESTVSEVTDAEVEVQNEGIVDESDVANVGESVADSNESIQEALGEDSEEELVSEEEQGAIEKNLTWKKKILLVAIVFVSLLLVFEIIFFIVQAKRKKKRKAKKQQEVKKEELLFDTGEIEVAEVIEETNPVVIRGNKICMDFARAVNEYTSIKDLAIQTVKGKRIKEVYRALNEVSFEIKKGEVIGVIGTNGAGKSTLLKIISGAMRPTSGSIQVNQGKVQILTLGTGFDMELTGRENVYLNGAIIGYEKEFIDQHYEEIVEFAELQDFMDEKVKNYSSGMVSRLGFAIATVGEAAEILILDEVLSVGDRIFQQKSMKRIKEMIHGGSTVIMVSHSTKTISENCDRAIWLEKGHMIAMGNAKNLCAAYEKYDGNFERVMRVKERVKRE